MDSFDMMGQFDSMLPPGDIFRKTFDSALMGLESKGGGGGAEDYTSEAHDYNKDMWEFNHDQAVESWNESLKINEVNRQNAYEASQNKLKIDREQYDFNHEQKRIKEEYEKAIYNRAQELKESQLTLNQIGFDDAITGNDNQFNERNQAATFQLTKALISKKEKTAAEMERLDVHSLAYDTGEHVSRTKELKAALEYDTGEHVSQTKELKAALELRATEATAREKKELFTLKQHKSKAAQAIKSQEDFVKDLKSIGTVKARGQAGPVTDKYVYEVMATKGRRDRALYDMATRSSDEYNAQMYGVDNAVKAASEKLALITQEEWVNRLLLSDKLALITQEEDINRSLLDKKLFISETYSELKQKAILDVYELAEDEVAASKVSAENAWRLSESEIYHKKSGADLSAWAKGGIPIPKGPAIPEPWAMPLATIIDPPYPNKPPKPVKGVGMAPGRSNQGMSTGSAVSAGLAVASAIPGPHQPFTLAGSFIAGMFDW